MVNLVRYDRVYVRTYLYFLKTYRNILPSLVAEAVKNPPTMRETRVWSLGREDPLEKEIATHSSIFASEIPWTEELVG